MLKRIRVDKAVALIICDMALNASMIGSWLLMNQTLSLIPSFSCSVINTIEKELRSIAVIIRITLCMFGQWRTKDVVLTPAILATTTASSEKYHSTLTNRESPWKRRCTEQGRSRQSQLSAAADARYGHCGKPRKAMTFLSLSFLSFPPFLFVHLFSTSIKLSRIQPLPRRLPRRFPRALYSWSNGILLRDTNIKCSKDTRTQTINPWSKRTS